MTKEQFTSELRRRLDGLGEGDLQSSLDFYGEIIDDLMETGTPEAEAVASLGSPAAVAQEILMNTPLPAVIKHRCAEKKHWRAWEIIALILGSPIWLSLAVVALALVISIYAVLWAVIVSLWAADVSLGAVAVGCLITGGVALLDGAAASALLYLGVVLAASGLCVAGFIGCGKLTYVFVKLSAAIGRWIKSLFIRKEKERKQTT